MNNTKIYTQTAKAAENQSLSSFEYQGIIITNPNMDEMMIHAVDPTEYYGHLYTNSIKNK